MNNPNLLQRMGATPGKLALVGVLALVLIMVVVGQLPDQTAPAELALRRPTLSHNQPKRQQTSQPQNIQDQTKPEHPESSISSESSTGSKEHSLEKPTWPDLTLDSIVAFDPLAPPEWLAAARTAAQSGEPGNNLLSETMLRARKAEVLKKLQEQGTTIVVISTEGKRATIGERTVRIGDQIEGFLITDITKQGVVLTEFEQ